MSNDLGDSHANSLGQGGALPANNTGCRIVGNIFAAPGTVINVNLYPTDTTQNVTVELLKNNVVVYSQQGLGTITGSYPVADTSWFTAVIKNSTATNKAQTVFVKLNYNAPASASMSRFPAPGNISCSSILTGTDVQPRIANSGYVYPNPCSSNELHLVLRSGEEKQVSILLFNSLGQSCYHENAKVYTGNTDRQIFLPEDLAEGLYLILVPELNVNIKLIVRK
jgi:alpha-amylase